MVLPVEMPREAISAFCVRNHIRKLSLFGSVLTPRFREASDIDMLVEFEPGRGPGLPGITRMERERMDASFRSWWGARSISELPAILAVFSGPR
jgi:predicted nucleotidyltransferase